MLICTLSIRLPLAGRGLHIYCVATARQELINNKLGVEEGVEKEVEKEVEEGVEKDDTD